MECPLMSSCVLALASVFLTCGQCVSWVMQCLVKDAFLFFSANDAQEARIFRYPRA